MIRYLTLGGLLAVALAVLLGLFARAPEAPVQAVTPVRQAVPTIGQPSLELKRSAEYFAELHPPPPPPPKPPAPPPKPPPPDIATLFRRDVGAIVGGPRVYVANADKGTRVSRLLKVGDVYADGWRLTALSTRSATLRRGREERVVSFFGPNTTPVAAPAAPPAPRQKKVH